MANATAQKILVVEDDPTAARLAQYSLEQEGYQVVIAPTGREGIDIAIGDPGINLVVLDLMLPDIDGTQVCAQIRANPVTETLPIMVFTATAYDGDRFMGLTAMGADAFVTKPADPVSIVDTARSLLR